MKFLRPTKLSDSHTLSITGKSYSENWDIDSLVRHDAAQKMGVWPLEADLQE
jgi:hypothetical protein